MSAVWQVRHMVPHAAFNRRSTHTHLQLCRTHHPANQPLLQQLVLRLHPTLPTLTSCRPTCARLLLLLLLMCLHGAHTTLLPTVLPACRYCHRCSLSNPVSASCVPPPPLRPSCRPT